MKVSLKIWIYMAGIIICLSASAYAAMDVKDDSSDISDKPKIISESERIDKPVVSQPHVLAKKTEIAKHISKPLSPIKPAAPVKPVKEPVKKIETAAEDTANQLKKVEETEAGKPSEN